MVESDEGRGGTGGQREWWRVRGEGEMECEGEGEGKCEGTSPPLTLFSGNKLQFCCRKLISSLVMKNLVS